MKIIVKISDYTEHINIISVYKSNTHRIIMFAEIMFRFAAIELIAFNNLTVIDELSMINFNKLVSTNTINFQNMTLKKLDDNIIKLILNQSQYNLIFKTNNEYYELDELDTKDSLNLLPTSNLDFAFKVYLKKSEILNEYIIDDYLDKIRLVGLNNLTKEEKTRLDKLVENIK